MQKARILLAMTVILAVVSAGLGKEQSAAAKSEDVKALAEAGNTFAAEMYARLAAGEKGNLFFSPASIHTALAMTCAGARGNTERQMALTLRFPYRVAIHPGPRLGAGPAAHERVPWPKDRVHPAFAALLKKLNTPRLDRDNKPAYQLVIANALWGQKDYKWLDGFLKVTKDNYGAALREVDFAKKAEQARRTINAWVEKQTKDKIKDLIQPKVLTGATRLVLTNAIYFKSAWADEFKKHATKDEPFYFSAEKAVKVPMMHRQGRYGYMETDAFQAVRIPYRYNDLSMIVFLPKKKDGLAAFEKILTGKNLAKWTKQLKGEQVRLFLPKFKFADSFRLADKLKAMGMTDAFSMGKADFSGMTSMEKLFISAVIHKAFVAVDEEGTEAAAATAVVMLGTGAPPRPKQPKVFKADHPFVFMIRHEGTGSMLFLGRVMNPKAK